MSDERFTTVMQRLSEVGENFGVIMKGGKSYTMVKDRVQVFREEFGAEYGIITNVEHRYGFDPGAAIVANAFIQDMQGHVIASGWAVEFVGSTKLTDASPVEIAETSAIGRALACFGLAGGEYASFNEIESHERKGTFRSNGGQNVLGPKEDSRPSNSVQQKQSNWYVPTAIDDFWDNPDKDIDMIVQEIERINDPNDLGRYWSDLKSVVDALKGSETGQGIIAEIKAAFATRHNAMGVRK